MRRVDMRKPIGIIAAAALFLLLGTTVPVRAQQGTPPGGGHSGPWRPDEGTAELRAKDKQAKDKQAKDKKAKAVGNINQNLPTPGKQTSQGQQAAPQAQSEQIAVPT